jgi:hypothetical protein
VEHYVKVDVPAPSKDEVVLVAVKQTADGKMVFARTISSSFMFHQVDGRTAGGVLLHDLRVAFDVLEQP